MIMLSNQGDTCRYGLYHRIVKDVIGGNCPMVTELDMSRVLDVGTGDGLWLMEMAAEYPSVDFIGCDIVDMMGHTPLPKNCRWEYGNILNKLSHDDNSFDLIHQRQIGCYITEKQWPYVARELFRLCRPGGRIILVEIELSLNTELNTILSDALQQSFVGTYRDTIAIPCGEWGGQVGRAMTQHLQMTMSAGAATALTTGRVSRAEYDALVDMARPIIGTNQSYHNLHIFVAEKPLGPTDRNNNNSRMGVARRQDARLR
ncbi:S-adenosyl-L-methionine-dependent methyltransferase [Syncephalis plumigaleata]|nr:S-adenosyl-L-methionine-dependent methyltransferase [Syncephalis plumigaleata]